MEKNEIRCCRVCVKVLDESTSESRISKAWGFITTILYTIVEIGTHLYGFCDLVAENS